MECLRPRQLTLTELERVMKLERQRFLNNPPMRADADQFANLISMRNALMALERNKGAPDAIIHIVGENNRGSFVIANDPEQLDSILNHLPVEYRAATSRQIYAHLALMLTNDPNVINAHPRFGERSFKSHGGIHSSLTKRAAAIESYLNHQFILTCASSSARLGCALHRS